MPDARTAPCRERSRRTRARSGPRRTRAGRSRGGCTAEDAAQERLALEEGHGAGPAAREAQGGRHARAAPADHERRRSARGRSMVTSPMRPESTRLSPPRLVIASSGSPVSRARMRQDAVGAEPALAPAHPRAGVELDAVERGVPLADGLDHLRLGDRSRSGTPRGRRRGRARPGLLQPRDRGADARGCAAAGRCRRSQHGFSASSSPCLLQQVLHVLGDRGGGGEPRGLDTRHLHEARDLARTGAMRKSSPGSVGRRPAKEVMMSRCAKWAGTMRPASVEDTVEVLGRGGQVVLVLDLLGGGADHEGALDRGDDEDALGVCAQARGRSRGPGSPRRARSSRNSSPLRGAIAEVLRRRTSPRPRRRAGPRRSPPSGPQDAARRREHSSGHPSARPRAAATSQPVRSVTPLATAFSTRAKTKRYGSMMPPVGA